MKLPDFKKITDFLKKPESENTNISKRTLLVILGVLAFAVISVLIVRNSDGAQKGKRYSESFFAMDTFMSVTCYGKYGRDAVTEVKKELVRMDKLLTAVGKEGGLTAGSYEASEVIRLNRDGKVVAGPELLAMLSVAKGISERTGGRYDLTVQPLVELWGFTTGKYHVPTEEELTEALSLVDYRSVTVDGVNVSLGAKQALGLGSIAKGYASERSAEIIKEKGVKSALLSLGGNVLCVGVKPDGKLWRVGVKNPRGTGSDMIGVLEVRDTAVITSGVYERNFTDKETKKTYHHILDPATGQPCENGILAVTVVSPYGTLADALSTALFVLGPEGADDYWRQYGSVPGEEFEMIYVTEAFVYATEGLKNSISCSEAVNWIAR